MSDSYDMVLRGGMVMTPVGERRVDVGVRDGTIVRLGNLEGADCAALVNCRGLHVLPGVIDTQVHFREPGLDHKEDLASGSLAAVMGGVTGVFEMPNTKPSTTTQDAIEDKLARARGRMWCEHAFYVGASAENAEQLAELETLPGTCGVKVFMGASTGDLLVWDDETLERVLRSGRRRVAIHAEDETRMNERKGERVPGDPASHPVWRDDETALRATMRAVSIARKTRRRIHVLHITTPEELAFLAANKDIASVEVLPQHLTLAAPDCYAQLGTFAQMNPPIRSSRHRDGLWYWLGQGVVDVIGSDHAPHTREEKARPYPDSPSGMPGVQTLLPLLLNHVARGKLSLERVVDLTSGSVNRLFNLVRKGRICVGYDADFTIVDLAKEWTITEDWLVSKCGWSPFTGMAIKGKPIGTIIRGQQVMWEDELLGSPIGAPFRFQETLR